MPVPLATILKLGSDVSGLVTGLNQGLSLIQKFGNAITGVMRGIVQVVEQGIQVLQRFGQSILTLTQQSARLDSMRDSFNKMAAGFGALGTDLLEAMNTATLGMAKDADLIQSSMTAMMLISQEAMGDVTKTIPMFAKIATAAARALGEDVGFMFDSLTRGIGRASPMILDNLGFTIRLSEVYGDFAKQLGITTKEMTKSQQQQALVNFVMREGAEVVEKLGISTGGLATKQKQLAKQFADLKDTIGQAFMPAVQALQGLFSELVAAIIEKVIPALRQLGRVFSEVFGTKNPFWRWVEGDVVQKTTERIQALVGELMELGQEGPNFMGGVTEATKEFNKAMGELNEKFGPRFARIQQRLVDQLASIWGSFNRQQTRRDEDFKRDEERRAEDHFERLREIRNRFDLDISEAIRKRDARALINLLRQRKDELDSEKDTFSEQTTRRKEDRETERKRAREDASRRAREAQANAAKEFAAVQAEFEKALAKIEAARNKSIAAAEKAWEAELQQLRDRIEKQKELRDKQMAQVEEIREEMSKPLPPFFENLKSVLEVVWGWLQKIQQILLGLISGEAGLGDIVPDGLVERIQELALTFKEIFGPDIVGIVKELGLIFKIFIEIIKELMPVLHVLAVIFGVSLIVALRTFLSMLRQGLENIRILLARVEAMIEGIKQIIEGGLQVILGLMFRNFDVVKKGLGNLVSGIWKLLINFWTALIRFFTGWLRVLWQPISQFFEDLIEGIVNLWDRLVGRSIIPDMLNAITQVVTTFITNITERWRTGWQGFVTIIQGVWTQITTVIGGAITNIGMMVSTWITGVITSVTSLITTIQRLATSFSTSFSLAGGGGQSFSFSADNWNIFGGGGQDDGQSVWEAMTGAINDTGSFFDQWRRR